MAHEEAAMLTGYDRLVSTDLQSQVSYTPHRLYSQYFTNKAPTVTQGT